MAVERRMPQRPLRTEGYSVEELDGELLLFNAASANVIALNETAALVWNLCDGSRTVEEIGALIAAAYPESAAEISGDVAEVVALFDRHGALARG
jgi:hypothetical protein